MRYYYLLFLFILVSCVPTPHDVKPAQESLIIYPDYQDITLPCNIAPLNFMLRGDFSSVNVEITNKEGTHNYQQSSSGNKVIFSDKNWHEIINMYLGHEAIVTITAQKDGQWWLYPSFTWNVSKDSIDAYITYRLIEPGYEVWDYVSIVERCIESFETRYLADGHELGNRCMNCHTHGGNNGQYSFFHLRGEKGGTILNRNGKLRKVSLKTPDMQSGAVYGDWHPSGQYAVFSGNVIIPSFHTLDSHRLEVYDTMSDLCVADFDHDQMLFPEVADKTEQTFETFPCFSADGRSIYFCTAPNPCGDSIPAAQVLLDHIKDLHYSLCRIDFNPEDGSFGSYVDTLYNGYLEGGSANFPKCSPDGRYLCFTRSGYGTFPIWHQEATLCMIDLDNTEKPIFDSHENGTYHTWSRNSRWLAFASKRSDGQYGRVHFAHVEDDGEIHLSKPVVLPQADPEMDDWNLRSYNIPDLSPCPVDFGLKDVKMLFENVTAEAFR